MYFCINELKVGVNDRIYSGNEQQKVYCWYCYCYYYHIQTGVPGINKGLFTRATSCHLIDILEYVLN